MASNSHNTFTKFDAFILIAFLLICAAGVIAPKVREHKREAVEERIDPECIVEVEVYEEPLWHWNDSIARARQAEKEAIRKQQSDQAREEIRRKQREYEANAGYDEGYHDGYECGHDDGDCNESYGFSYLSDEKLARYTRAYCRGFDVGYREGFADGREDFEYNHGI